MGEERRAGTDGRHWCWVNSPPVKPTVWLSVHDSVGWPCIWLLGSRNGYWSVYGCIQTLEVMLTGILSVLPVVPKELLGQIPQAMILGRPVCLPGPGAGTPKGARLQKRCFILSLGPTRTTRPSLLFLPRPPLVPSSSTAGFSTPFAMRYGQASALTQLHFTTGLGEMQVIGSTAFLVVSFSTFFLHGMRKGR